MKYINLGRETIGMAFDLGITAVGIMTALTASER